MESIIRNGLTIIEMPEEKKRTNKKTGILGTSISQSGKIRLEVSHKGKHYYLGVFEKVEDAQKMKNIADQKEKDGTFPEWYEAAFQSKKNKYGVMGLSYRKDRNNYSLQIGYKRKKYALGEFQKIEDAAPVRKEAEKQIEAGTFEEWIAERRKSRQNNK